jgi:hypothetical protein
MVSIVVFPREHKDVLGVEFPAKAFGDVMMPSKLATLVATFPHITLRCDLKLYIFS